MIDIRFPPSDSSNDSDDTSSVSSSSSDEPVRGKKEAEKIASVLWPTVSQVEDFTIKIAKALVQASAYGDEKDISLGP